MISDYYLIDSNLQNSFFFEWSFCQILFLNVRYFVLTVTTNKGNIPITIDDMRQKVREEFYKNKDITDLRAKDLLIHEVRLYQWYLL